jgi:hypothetical protein
MRRTDLGRNGVALLEAMIALAILGGAGTAAISLVAAGLRSAAESRAREDTIINADRVLTATTLLLRSELDRRLGERRVGELVVRVARPEPTLYRLAVADATHPATELLVTVVYRPEPGTP